MTSLCVAGGTGQVGREVVRLALDAGCAVSVLTRHTPPAGSAKHHDGATYFAGDVTTGSGVAAPVAGAEVVMDCLEGLFGKARRNLADGGERLLAAARRAGVGKAVVLSIINCDLSTNSFYVSKVDKERLRGLRPGDCGCSCHTVPFASGHDVFRGSQGWVGPGVQRRQVPVDRTHGRCAGSA